ncbi:coiled-coil domain-containing protein 124 [Geospiza fortis]|uniref:Coiled-coil domain-containing protein 124 n=1 Tax=Geospiza fortis TaxID=48883 RepID=A0A6I9ZCB5_GEOFO|nr:coiled-coil domain-containing protein 124 [Geospiza fortis]
MPKKFQGENSKSAAAREEREKRRLEQLERRKELQRLLEEEDSKLKGKSPKQGNPGKITRAQIEENVRKEQGEGEIREKPPGALPLEENLNRRLPEEGAVEARSIEDAIAALSVSQPLERHPERRLRGRLSQLRQLLKKEWMRSPENPLNQRHKPYNSHQ